MHRAVCSSLWRKGPGRARPGAMLSLSSPVAFCATKDGPCGSSSKISVHWLRLPAFISTHIMCDKAADSNFIRNITEAPAAKTQRGCYNNNFCKKKKKPAVVKKTAIASCSCLFKKHTRVTMALLWYEWRGGSIAESLATCRWRNRWCCVTLPKWV